jgi:hypothetical protein
VHAPSKIKGRGRELQLPSIQQLTSKSSSQHFLLRILKVIIQLRQATKTAMNKSHTAGKPPVQVFLDVLTVVGQVRIVLAYKLFRVVEVLTVSFTHTFVT